MTIPLIELGNKKVPLIGQGTWHMGENPSKKEREIKALQKGLDLGLSLIDTAEMYGDGKAEEVVGEAIKGRRPKAFIVSKVLPSNASRKGIALACEESLKRLGTDYIDLYLLHWRSSYPIFETVGALEILVEEGKILNWGVSNLDTTYMEEIFQLDSGKNCTTNQILYNPFRRGPEFDLIPWCQKNKIPIMAYSPMEQGRILNNKALVKIAEKHGTSTGQICLAWILMQDKMMVIPKSSTPKHIKENAKAWEIKLDEDDLKLINAQFPPPAKKEVLAML